MGRRTARKNGRISNVSCQPHQSRNLGAIFEWLLNTIASRPGNFALRVLNAQVVNVKTLGRTVQEIELLKLKLESLFKERYDYIIM